MANLTKEELAACQAACPDAKRFGKVLFQGESLYFRNPTDPEFRQFDLLFSQNGQEAQAYHTLALLTSTKRDRLVALIADFPGLTKSAALVNLLNQLSGIGQLEEAK